MFTTDMGGYWMVQTSGMMQADYLYNDDGEKVTELTGTLNVNFVMSGLYIFTFGATEG